MKPLANPNDWLADVMLNTTRDYCRFHGLPDVAREVEPKSNDNISEDQFEADLSEIQSIMNGGSA